MDDLKQLTKIIKLCTKYGLKSFKNEQVELVFSDEIQTELRNSKQKSKLVEGQNEEFKTDGPSQEELLFWSSSGPEVEPGEMQ